MNVYKKEDSFNFRIEGRKKTFFFFAMSKFKREPGLEREINEVLWIPYDFVLISDRSYII